MKVHKAKPKFDKNVVNSFKEIPFEDGDILYIKIVKKQPKKHKVNDEWVVVPDTFEWWIKDYIKVI